jgi:hypothetical protein
MDATRWPTAHRGAPLRDDQGVAEKTSIRRPDVALVAAVVAAMAVPGVVLLLWAEARVHSDNQRSWAYLGGTIALAGAGAVGLLALASAIRHHAGRRTQLTFATVLLASSGVLLIALGLSD